MFSPISQNAPTLPPTPANADMSNMSMTGSHSKNLVAKMKKSKFKFRKEEKLEKVTACQVFFWINFNKINIREEYTLFVDPEKVRNQI